jgi:hypothetical protein
MICFECAKTSEVEPAVAVCQHCGVGLCFEHLVVATRQLVGGTHEGCRHEIPQYAPIRVDDREPVEVA